MKQQVDYHIDLLKKGSQVEFRKIYFDFFDVLYALSLQYTSDRFVAESIVQDAFTRLWEYHGSLLPQTNIRNFLYTVTKNLSLNYLRDQKVIWKHLNQLKSNEYRYAIESLSGIGSSYLEFEELRNRADQAIEQLPDELKIVFKMNRFESMKYREIAEKLQISEKTVEARMTRALKILRTDLNDYLPLLFTIINFFR
mgnify:CR=1 FL=1